MKRNGWRSGIHHKGRVAAVKGDGQFDIVTVRRRGITQEALGRGGRSQGQIIGGEAVDGALDQVPRDQVTAGVAFLGKGSQITAAVVQDHPQVTEVGLGVALRRQQKHRQALECYQQALKLDPKNEKVYFNLGVLHFDTGEKEKALEAFRVALKLHPDFTEAQDFLQHHFLS